MGRVIVRVGHVALAAHGRVSVGKEPLAITGAPGVTRAVGGCASLAGYASVSKRADLGNPSADGFWRFDLVLKI